MANQHDAKYVETSVTLHHHVDELLVGIIRQIRKQLNVTFPDISPLFNKKQKYTKGPRNFLKRILRLNKKNKEPVENVIEYWPVLYRINTDQCYIELFYVKVDVQIMTVINSTLPNIYCVYIYCDVHPRNRFNHFAGAHCFYSICEVNCYCFKNKILMTHYILFPFIWLIDWSIKLQNFMNKTQRHG